MEIGKIEAKLNIEMPDDWPERIDQFGMAIDQVADALRGIGEQMALALAPIWLMPWDRLGDEHAWAEWELLDRAVMSEGLARRRVARLRRDLRNAGPGELNWAWRREIDRKIVLLQLALGGTEKYREGARVCLLNEFGWEIV